MSASMRASPAANSSSVRATRDVSVAALLGQQAAPRPQVDRVLGDLGEEGAAEARGRERRLGGLDRGEPAVEPAARLGEVLHLRHAVAPSGERAPDQDGRPGPEHPSQLAGAFVQVADVVQRGRQPGGGPRRRGQREPGDGRGDVVDVAPRRPPPRAAACRPRARGRRPGVGSSGRAATTRCRCRRPRRGPVRPVRRRRRRRTRRLVGGGVGDVVAGLGVPLALGVPVDLVVGPGRGGRGRRGRARGRRGRARARPRDLSGRGRPAGGGRRRPGRRPRGWRGAAASAASARSTCAVASAIEWATPSPSRTRASARACASGVERAAEQGRGARRPSGPASVRSTGRL